jgi:DNA-binding transcriptional LysR family regulator
MSDNIKLSQLRILVAVAQQGSFSEAALQQSISQSAVSHAIASLEDELGVTLVFRGRHGAVLTPIGEQVIAHAQKILSHVEAISREAYGHRGLQGGTVRLASFRSAATHIIPPVIARFRQRFPDITVNLMEHDVYEQVEQELRAGRADIGFTQCPAPPEFETWEVMNDEYVALLPPSCQKKQSADSDPQPKLSWADLASQPLILVMDGSECSLKVWHYLRHSGRALRIAYEVKQDSTAVGMVAQGLGIAILPRLAAEPVLPGIQVCSLPNRLERVIGVAVLKGGLHSPASYVFLDALLGRGLFESLPQLTLIEGSPVASGS